jgi:hypothetical protein
VRQTASLLLQPVRPWTTRQSPTWMAGFVPHCVPGILTCFRSRAPHVADKGEGSPELVEDNDGGDDVSTASDVSDPRDEQPFKIDLPDRSCMVYWEDADKQEQHTTELRLSLYTDCSRDRALFKLHGSVFLKTRGSNNKRSLFLFIYPENLQSIECGASNRSKMPGTRKNASISLRFTMTQPPSFVVPKNQPVNPKKVSQGVLDAIQALAKVKLFTIYLNSLNLAPETREQLALFPSVLATHKHLLTDQQRANLDTLYQGQGGEVVNFSETPATCSGAASSDTPTTAAVQVKETAVTSKEEDEALPPPYSESSLSGSGLQACTGFGTYLPPLGAPCVSPSNGCTTIRLRPCESQSNPAPPDKKRRPTSEPPSPPTQKSKRVLLAYGHLTKRIDGIESHLKRLEEKVDRLLNADPCRFDSEERDALFAHVNTKISDDMDSVRFELEDKVLDRADELVMEKTSETPELVANRTDELWADMKLELMAQMRREISLQIKGEVMAEIAQRMATAFGTGEEPKKLPGVRNSSKT